VSDAPASVSVNDGPWFLLELAALAALGYWGWTTADGSLRFVLAVGLPLVAALLWGVFRVPGDPGPAPVPVPVRLLLEATLFGAAVGLLALAGQPLAAGVLAALLVGHYVTARERVVRLAGW
jgi:hypothetical protein